MKQSLLWGIVPVTVVLAVFGVFYVLFPDRLASDGTLFSSVALLSLAAGSTSYVPFFSGGRKVGDAGWLSTIGIGTVLSFLLLIVAAAGVFLAVATVSQAAMAVNIVTVAGFVVMLVAVKATASAVGAIGASKGGKSSHTVWADRLQLIGNACPIPELKTKILRLAGETRFLASDAGSAASEVNLRIAATIEALAEPVRRGDEADVLPRLAHIRNLFAQREIDLMNVRSKV